ncbi:hypothetical protein Y032_0011g1449 [Ancylostoma ceylanicum]|uniref:Uncharacterized protein n=1 Tax=Ancylostoma ceylanicum TaxID=53326 RepID=A0A016VGL7_9BILA|nr:hypothetical protein Y032_0011g1449 [Ancylostoma ceylanicum]
MAHHLRSIVFRVCKYARIFSRNRSMRLAYGKLVLRSAAGQRFTALSVAILNHSQHRPRSFRKGLTY